jgi:hypothetical protein
MVAILLKLRGIEVFLPHITPHRRSRSDERVDLPLFPGFLFARLMNRSEAQARAQHILDFGYVVGRGGSPSSIPDDLVVAIREVVVRGFTRPAQHPILAANTGNVRLEPITRLTEGLDGFLTPRGRVRVLIATLKQLIPLDSDAAQAAIAHH